LEGTHKQYLKMIHSKYNVESKQFMIEKNVYFLINIVKKGLTQIYHFIFINKQINSKGFK